MTPDYAWGDRPVALIRGAGDLASGVAVRLWRSGFAVVMTEVASPTVVRRTVAFAEAVYEGHAKVEDIEGLRTSSVDEMESAVARGAIPVVVDPNADVRRVLRPDLLVDAVMAKRNLGTCIDDAPAVVALGPGFTAGRDADAVIETMRGHDLGRVIYCGAAAPNTGIPGEIAGYAARRVLRSPVKGEFIATARIGDMVSAADIVGYVGKTPVKSEIHGLLRGLLHSGLPVQAGHKLGDVDPRAQTAHCYSISDKAMAIAGGVLEAACLLLGGVRFSAL
mgnify:CR=1 FL=1